MIFDQFYKGVEYYEVSLGSASNFPFQYVVKQVPRLPILRIKTRTYGALFLDRNAKLYKPSTALLNSTILPTFDILLEDDPINYQFDSTLTTSSNNQVIFKDSINLVSELSQRKVKFDQLSFREHLGFTITLSSGVTVTIGHTPFQQKIIKLDETLKRLALNHIEAAHIDLDYNGKAFIRKKTESTL